MLSVPPNRAHSSLLTHPGSSRVGKEGEQLIYFGDTQEQASPEFSVSWRIFFLLGICSVASIIPGILTHVISFQFMK